MRAPFLLTLAVRILWRSWRATLVLSFMIMSAVAALVFLLALAVGTNDAMIRNSTGLYTGHIVGGGMNNGEVSGLRLPGVKQVLVRQHLPVLLWSEAGVEPVDLVGVQPEQEMHAAAYWKKIVRGAYLANQTDAIFLSEAVCKRLGAELGDYVRVINRQGHVLQSLRIAGIYRTGITALDYGVAFTPIQAVSFPEENVTTASFLEADVSPELVVAQYRKHLPGASFLTWSEFMPDLKQLIDMNDFCMAIVIFLVFAIVSMGTACAFLIFTLKNLREHGIMKAMGFQPVDTAMFLLMQIGLLTLLASAVGALAGMLCVGIFSHVGIDMTAYISHNQYFAVSGVLYPRLTAFALWAPPLVALVFSLLAAVWPVITVLRNNPADILRNV